MDNIFSKTCTQDDVNKACEFSECCAIFTEFNKTDSTKIFKCMDYSHRIVYAESFIDRYYNATVYTEKRYIWEC